MPCTRFAVDRMLGRLATWLRLIGQDASYDAHLGTAALVRQASREGRTILTRDRRLLYSPHHAALLFITSDHFRDQLRQVVGHFHLDPCAQLCTRCARCNALVEGVGAATVADRVPPYVLATQPQFVRCPRCNRVYWSATHCERIRAELVAMGLGPRH